MKMLAICYELLHRSVSMLKFNGAWRFHPPATLSSQVINEFSDLIGKIAAQGDLQEVLEHFKNYFAGAAGTTSSWSSNASWAETDLHRLMNAAAQNAPLFIASFYDACESLKMKNAEFYTPDTAMINAVLSKYGVEFEVRPPNLLARGPNAVPIPVPEQPASLDEQAQEIIQQSLQQSEQLLAEGRHRQAVQEILWLLETVSTAFQGLDTGAGTVQGKYFNKIAEDLRRHHKGKTIEQVLTWVTTLHGYLSSPTGGGVRHGTDLKASIAIKPNEARLFCNLIRSYISYLMAEHERLSKG
jgi:hypothetical protein